MVLNIQKQCIIDKVEKRRMVMMVWHYYFVLFMQQVSTDNL